ncbi:MAG: hypothetical protein EA400_13520 [Chromatiaceae bacterium]|nr:MAG: hypothetical protein EA400_13520 [Chromatiaceae bacterium]
MFNLGWRGTCRRSLTQPQRDGTPALTPNLLELIDRLPASITPLRRHRHRCDGVLGPNSPLRAAAVPGSTCITSLPGNNPTTSVMLETDNCRF